MVLIVEWRLEGDVSWLLGHRRFGVVVIVHLVLSEDLASAQLLTNFILCFHVKRALSLRYVDKRIREARGCLLDSILLS